jgi:predicted acylesterase/phospholipase RssA
MARGDIDKGSPDPSDPQFGSDEGVDAKESLAIALSGGGLRATLFQLGILLYLALVDELKHVDAVVSVSGGSILAAHLATRWDQAKRSPKDFTQVASDLIRFVRRDIRNSAMVPWIWSRCLVVTWLLPSWRRSAFLQHQYKAHFQETTLGDLPSVTNIPRSVFVATDTIEQRRVALMREGIVRFDFAGEVDGAPILAKGVHLFLAVAASSCFPPVFESLYLTYRELGITFDEFKGSLTLNDGGVAGNLGVEVLAGLIKRQQIVAKRMLVCDAERSLAEKPVAGLLASINAEGAALSAAARQVVQQLGSDALLVRFAHRSPEDNYLPFRVQTKLFNYRTDLDRPTWQECHALMMHGAASCQRLIGLTLKEVCPSTHQVRAAIREVLETAGAPKELPTPTEKDLDGCGNRSYLSLLVHATLALAVFLAGCASVSELAAYLHPSWPYRPLSALSLLLCPEPITERTIDDIADALAAAACAKTMDNVDPSLLKPELSRIAIKVGPNPTSSLLYVKKALQPSTCDHQVACEFVFSLANGAKQFHMGDAVTVVGRNGNIHVTPLGRNVQMNFNECTVVHQADH